MGLHRAHDQMQVPLGDVLLVLPGHHRQGFLFGFIAAFVIDERRLDLPIVDLVFMGMAAAGDHRCQPGRRLAGGL